MTERGKGRGAVTDRQTDRDKEDRETEEEEWERGREGLWGGEREEGRER